jgi:hypothetical protein
MFGLGILKGWGGFILCQSLEVCVWEDFTEDYQLSRDITNGQLAWQGKGWG